MATLREIIEQAILIYNDGSDNEEYLRGQLELADHIFEYYGDKE